MRKINLQLSISIWHSWRSIGKYCKFIGHDAVIVNLKSAIFRYIEHTLIAIIKHILLATIHFHWVGNVWWFWTLFRLSWMGSGWWTGQLYSSSDSFLLYATSFVTLNKRIQNYYDISGSNQSCWCDAESIQWILKWIYKNYSQILQTWKENYSKQNRTENQRCRRSFDPRPLILPTQSNKQSPKI